MRRIPAATSAVALAFVGCSLVFPADDLSRGAAGTGAGETGAGGVHGSGGATGGGGENGDGGGGKTGGGTKTGGGSGGGCVDDAACGPSDGCFEDRCVHGACDHKARTGEACDPADGCHPTGTCTATGDCAPGPPPSMNLCGALACPDGFYRGSVFCDLTTPDCNDCSAFCVNTMTCFRACEPQIMICCNAGDCDHCPTGYALTGEIDDYPPCGCIPGHAGVCKKGMM